MSLHLDEYFAICEIRPEIGRNRFEEPDESEERYESIRRIFDNLCFIRKQRVLNSPDNEKKLEILYSTPRSVAHRAKSSPAVDLSPELRARTAEARMDFGNVPVQFLQSLGNYLDHGTLLRCRLVCHSWNQGMTTGSPAVLLDRTVFRLNQSLDLVERCNTQVKWRHVKTSFFPCIETQSVYHQKYLVNKLHQDAMNNNKERKIGQFSPLFCRVTSLTVTNVELSKDCFLKWLTTCASGTLRTVEFHSCVVKKSKIIWKSRGGEKGSETGGISTLKGKNMSLASLVEFGTIILVVSKALKVLEIGVRQTHEIQRIRRTKLETDLSSVLLEIVTTHGRSLESVEVTLPPFSQGDGFCQLFTRLGACVWPKLENFGFTVIKNGDEKVTILNPRELGFLGYDHVTRIVERLVRGGKLKRLSVPFWGVIFNVKTTMIFLSSSVRVYSNRMILCMVMSDITTSSGGKFWLSKLGITGDMEELLKSRKVKSFRYCNLTSRKKPEERFQDVFPTQKRQFIIISNKAQITGPEKLDPHSSEKASILYTALLNLHELGAQFRLVKSDNENSGNFENFEVEDLDNLQKSREVEVNNGVKENNYVNPLLSKIFGEVPRLLTKLVIYGTVFPARLKRCFPFLKELRIVSDMVTPTDFVRILDAFPKLESLCISEVKDFEDVTLMGVEPKLMQFLKEKSLSRRKNKMEKNHALFHLQNLRILRLHGAMEVTDMGILHSFTGMKNLEILEMSGSKLNVSNTGLAYIAANCPQLREVVLDLSKDTIDDAGIEAFLGQLPLLQKHRGRISVL
ncbi:F-box/LRR-repeat protein 17 [Folsomia candida]|uniref:F-box/LRR-repeat protein 17 n=1 Tax=Folsomia candida TaxID=158441 RepID=A0A226DP50_FOLCA|nr:F-box/LRR-repeat protein 17 [Folsomia candida]